MSEFNPTNGREILPRLDELTRAMSRAGLEACRCCGSYFAELSRDKHCPECQDDISNSPGMMPETAVRENAASPMLVKEPPTIQEVAQ